ncbi:TPA: molecular chaperone [Enterobacter hormaechei subsp. steigerwaltii]|nr:molecular chaperone [Enterobacter hormaechei subsp. steigerwaltii]
MTLNSVAGEQKGGFRLDTTRVIFPSENESTSFRAVNSTKENVWLLKAWVSEFESTNTDNIPFFISPPLIRINENESTQFRINKLPEANHLPKDKESIFHVNVMAVPPSRDTKDNAGYVELSVVHQIKLFYRPKSIDNKKDIEGVHKKIKVIRDKEGVRIKNPTPYYASLGNVLLNDKEVRGETSNTIAPFSDLVIPSKDNVKSITFQLINDFGGLSRPVSVIL